MTKSVLTAAIWLTLGVIFGFAILLISEQGLLTFSNTEPSTGRSAAPGETEPLLVAELKAEIAELEARLARLALRPETTPRIRATRRPAVDSPALAGPALDARPRTTRTSEHAPLPRPSLGEIERMPAPPEYAEEAVIEGTVHVELGGRPVSEFTLGVKSEDGSWARKDVKDTKGRFFWILDPGRARVFISAPGYTDWLRTDLVLERGMVTRIKVRLSPDRRIEGRVGTDDSATAAALRHAG